MPTSMSASASDTTSQAIDAAFKSQGTFSFSGGNVTIGGSGGSKSSSEAAATTSDADNKNNLLIIGVAVLSILLITLKKG